MKITKSYEVELNGKDLNDILAATMDSELAKALAEPEKSFKPGSVEINFNGSAHDTFTTTISPVRIIGTDNRLNINPSMEIEGKKVVEICADHILELKKIKNGPTISIASKFTKCSIGFISHKNESTMLSFTMTIAKDLPGEHQ